MSLQTENLVIISATPLTSLSTTQRVDIRAGGAIEIETITQGVWIKLGDVTVVATAGTAGETLISPNGGPQRYDRKFDQQYVAVIQAAASATASVTVLG